MKKEFTVYRSRWLRGLGPKASGLARESETSDTGYRYCCLGFLAMQLMAMDTKDIQQLASITDLVYRSNQAVFSSCPIRIMDSSEEYLMNTNDDPCLTDEAREEILTELFAKQDITVHFKE